MIPTVAVSAAILLRDGRDGKEYLLARRPPDKVYAGYWEFPGGKLETGESFHDALVRELSEELGIDVERATPWLYREFGYPHAHVRLKFFRVTAWRGAIQPHEHTGTVWTRLGDPPAVAPVLPANGPILRALALPEIYAVTHAEENGVQTELDRIDRALHGGIRLLQIRDKTLAANARRHFAEAVMARARAWSDACVLVNDDEALARAIGAQGLHLTSQTLGKLAYRPDFAWVAASCHTTDDLRRAAQLGVDFVVLGPVLPTASHPGAPALGWETFGRLIDRLTLPTYAIGGMRTAMLPIAQAHGAHGIAMLRGW